MGEEGIHEIIKKGSILCQRFFQSKILEWENQQIKENCLSPPTPQKLCLKDKAQSSKTCVSLHCGQVGETLTTRFLA